MPENPRFLAAPRRLALRLGAVVGALLAALATTVLVAAPALADYTGPFVPPNGIGPASSGTLPSGLGPNEGDRGNGLLPDTGSDVTMWLVALALLLVVVGFALLRRARRAAL